MIVLSPEALRNLLEYMTAVREEVRAVLERDPVANVDEALAPVRGHLLTPDQITEVMDQLAAINEFFVAAILDAILM